MAYTRRKFIQRAGSAGLVAAVGAGFSIGVRADWGDAPPGSESAVFGTLPASGYKILEIFLYGGISPWETFYHRTDVADPWYNLPSPTTLDWECPNSPSASDETRFFATDDLARDIALGPATRPLWNPDLLSKMRIVMMRHNLKPHEAAIPYSLTGHELGAPNFASLGAAVAHRNFVLGRVTPLSYAMIPMGLFPAADNFNAIDAVGTHSGQYRPLRLGIGGTFGEFKRQLGTAWSDNDSAELVKIYDRMYQNSLTSSTGYEVRSKGYAAYSASLASGLDASLIDSILASTPDTPNPGNTCLTGLPPQYGNVSELELDLAVHLLNHPEGAQHVSLIDSGLRKVSGTPYDTHSNHVAISSMNLFNILTLLTSRLNTGSTIDPSKINLADTLVVLKTEFGRSQALDGTTGRQHWPEGYANVLIGGPVQGPSITGALDDAGNGVEAMTASDSMFYTPADLQGALLLAAGVFPLVPECFNVGNFGPVISAATEPLTAARLRTQLLGVA